jgi:hypothetical protein
MACISETHGANKSKAYVRVTPPPTVTIIAAGKKILADEACRNARR